MLCEYVGVLNETVKIDVDFLFIIQRIVQILCT